MPSRCCLCSHSSTSTKYSESNVLEAQLGMGCPKSKAALSGQISHLCRSESEQSHICPPTNSQDGNYLPRYGKPKSMIWQNNLWYEVNLWIVLNNFWQTIAACPVVLNPALWPQSRKGPIIQPRLKAATDSVLSGSWTRWPLMVPSNSSDSTVLWFWWERMGLQCQVTMSYFSWHNFSKCK